MISVRIHDYGGSEALVLDETPQPVPEPHQVLIRTAALGINPVDWKLCSGAFHEHMPLAMPCTLGADLAGTVCAMSVDQQAFEIGERVFAMVGLSGAYAEFVAVDAGLVAPSPKTLDDVESASVPLAALTAWQGLFEHGDLKSGESLLVHGAAGGVGIFAVQFAKFAGARVLATASKKNADFVRELGADGVFDYRAAEAQQFPTGLDAAIDLVGDDPVRLLSALKYGGTLIQVSPGRMPDLQAEAEKRGIRLIAFQVRPHGARLREIANLIDAGKATTHVSEVMPIADIARAHSLSREGHVCGKIVVTVERPSL